MIPSITKKVGPGFITLTEGDEIRFGGGLEGEQLNKGPSQDFVIFAWLLSEF